jgi:tRNA(Ile)-lysidine synthase
MTLTDLPRLFQSALEALAPDWRDRKFLIAYSGGLDSTALLRLMALSLPAAQAAAAHFNHGWRGPAAERDQAFAALVAAELGLAFFTAQGDPASLARSRKKGLEEAARLTRYEFLARSARDWGADFILTAHQADDQAETILMNLLKGAGPTGLAGIPPRRPLGGLTVLRPLLAFSRQTLKSWLDDRGHVWLEDESNDDRRFWRNAVRGELLPVLKQWNPRLLEALGRSTALMRAEEDFWQNRLAELWSRVVLEESPDEIRMDSRLLAALSLAERRRLVHAGLTRIQRARDLINEPVTFAAVETALGLASENHRRGLDLPGGVRASAEGPILRLSAASRLASRDLQRSGRSGEGGNLK